MLRYVAGLIPATPRTPDIYYCNDPDSETVAALTFLTMWFLPSGIQGLILERTCQVICGLSPLSGGARMEKLAVRGGKKAAMTYRKSVDIQQINNHWEKYIGYSYGSRWSKEGQLVRQGLMAVYAKSVAKDNKEGLSHSRTELFRGMEQDLDLPAENALFSPVLDFPSNQWMAFLNEILVRGGPDQEDDLADLFVEILRKADPDMLDVPLTTTHEIAHQFYRKYEILPHHTLRQEIAGKKFALIAENLDYYLDPVEAAVELAGIALLHRLEDRTGIIFSGLWKKTNLHHILKKSFPKAQRIVEHLCTYPKLYSARIKTESREPT